MSCATRAPASVGQKRPRCYHLWYHAVSSSPRCPCAPRSQASRSDTALRRRPLLELDDELVVRYRHRRPFAARVPAPEHQLVLADVRDQRSEVAAAVALLVLDHLAERGGRETDPRHLVVRRRQPPVRRAWRRGRAVARGRGGFAMAGCTGP